MVWRVRVGGEQLALDHSPHVRECSCFCLGQFAEHCQPEILDHSEEVLPIVFRLLDDATDNVKVGTSFDILKRRFLENSMNHVVF